MKPAQDSHTLLQLPVYASMVDRFGWADADPLVKLIDAAGCIPAKRHLGADLDPVTAWLDPIRFYSPVRSWEVFCVEASLTRRWSTSMETQLDLSAWNFRTSEERSVGQTYMVTVARADKAQAKASPEAIPELGPTGCEDEADARKRWRQEYGALLKTAHTLALSEQSLVILKRSMSPQDSNGLSHFVFGGVVLSVLYQGAFQSAQQALGADRHLACVLQDGVSFLQPALIDDTLSVRAAVVAQLGRGLDIHVICYRNGELSERVAETYFRFVQLDTEGKSQPIEHSFQPPEGWDTFSAERYTLQQRCP